MREELWMVRGRHPVLWTVPFYVTWSNEDEGEMFAAIPLLRTHQQAVDFLIANHARRVNGLWEIPREELEKIAEPTGGGDPEVYFSWERIRAAQLPENRPDRRVERDEFIDAFYQAGGGRSRDECEHWWFQFCNFAIDWLINKEKPVDMYFVQLQPMPYRVDWKEKIFRENQARKFYTFRARARELRASPRFNEFLLSEKLLAIDKKGGACYRFIEVEHLPAWWKAIKQVERTRLQRLNKFQYAARFIASIHRHTDAAIRIYSSWLAKKGQVSPVVVKGRVEGKFSFLPAIRAERLPRSTEYCSRRLGRIIYLTKYRNSGQSKKVSGENAPLPEMPAVQPETKDVRDGRPDI